MQQSNCNAAAQLWHVSVLKEQGREKNSPNHIAGSKQRASPRATWREREREEGGNKKKSIDNQRRSRRRRKKKSNEV